MLSPPDQDDLSSLDRRKLRRADQGLFLPPNVSSDINTLASRSQYHRPQLDLKTVRHACCAPRYPQQPANRRTAGTSTHSSKSSPETPGPVAGRGACANVDVISLPRATSILTYCTFWPVLRYTVPVPALSSRDRRFSTRRPRRQFPDGTSVFVLLSGP